MEEAKFIILEDGQGPDVCIYQDEEGARFEIGWSAPPNNDVSEEAIKQKFRWLVESAATHHMTQVETETIK